MSLGKYFKKDNIINVPIFVHELLSQVDMHGVSGETTAEAL
jgi:hypothetical protein